MKAISLPHLHSQFILRTHPNTWFPGLRLHSDHVIANPGLTITAAEASYLPSPLFLAPHPGPLAPLLQTYFHKPHRLPGNLENTAGSSGSCIGDPAAPLTSVSLPPPSGARAPLDPMSQTSASGLHILGYSTLSVPRLMVITVCKRNILFYWGILKIFLLGKDLKAYLNST